MPWDATELRVASYDVASGASTAGHQLIAGSDGDTSVLQPAWHPSSGALYYISDESGYWNLYRAPSSLKDGASSARCPAEVDFGGSSPGWSFGQQGFAFLADGRCAASYTDTESGKTTLLTFADEDDAAAAEASVRRFDSDDGLPAQFGRHAGRSKPRSLLGASLACLACLAFSWLACLV